MKHTLLVLAGLMLSMLSGIAQNTVNLIIFSEDGDAFYAYVNGVKQNAVAETNVKLTGLSPNISLKIQFENPALPQIKQAMALEPGFEHTARIKKDMKGELKLRYFGQAPIGGNSVSSNSPGYNTAEPNDNSPSAPENSTNVDQTTTVYNTTTSTKGTGDNASVNVNVGGVGISMSVNTNETGANTDIHTSSSTTVTNSSSSSASYSENSRQSTNQQPVNSDASTKRNCSGAMSEASFGKMKESIESKPFSDTKMSTARVATKNACLSVNQIKQICSLFSMDDDRLTYAKFAHEYCVDKANYYQVSEVFSFSGTTDELNKFLEN
jgi:hypothetical protein